ncbi:MAG: hypothetical protein IJJ33_14110, partial [Victivallales bacterium]|nr:hypothetical protein [Victivallales bacterium]
MFMHTPYRFSALLLFALLTMAMPWASAAIYTQDDDGVTVKTPFAQLWFSRKQGYTLRKLTVGNHSVEAAGGVVIWWDGEPDTYRKRYPAPEKPVHLSGQPAECVIRELGNGEVELCVKRTFSGGSVMERMVFDDSCQAKGTLDFHYSQRPFALDYALHAWNISGTKGRGIFYPEQTHDIAIREDYPWKLTPSWNYFYNSELGVGAGLVAPQDGGPWQSLVGNTKSPADGLDMDVTLLKLTTRPLRHDAVPGTVHLNFGLLLGGTPELAEGLSLAQLPAPPDLEVENLRLDRLCVEPGGEQRLTARLVNHSATPCPVTVEVEAEWSLGQKTSLVKPEPVVIPAHSSYQYMRNWTFPTDVSWGVEICLRVQGKQGTALTAREFCGVSNRAARLVGLGICNPAFCGTPGTEDAWTEAYRRNYVGLLEYYCWYPSGIGGLAPTEESWHPHMDLEGM